MPTTTTTMAVCCPFCGSADEVIHLNLNNLDSIVCGGCDQEFTAEDARDKAAETLAAWDKVMRLVETAKAIAAE